jgi:hypothetical protein
MFQANVSQKQAGENIIIHDKVDFKKILFRKVKEGHFILKKGQDNLARRSNSFKQIHTKLWLYTISFKTRLTKH